MQHTVAQLIDREDLNFRLGNGGCTRRTDTNGGEVHVFALTVNDALCALRDAR